VDRQAPHAPPLSAADPARRYPARERRPPPPGEGRRGGGPKEDIEEFEQVFEEALDISADIYQVEYSMIAAASYYPDKPINDFLIEKANILFGLRTMLDDPHILKIVEYITTDILSIPEVKEKYDELFNIFNSEIASMKDTTGLSEPETMFSGVTKEFPAGMAYGGSRFRNLKYTRKTRRKQRKTRTTRVRRSKRHTKK
jgi:hypothetical protein